MLVSVLCAILLVGPAFSEESCGGTLTERNGVIQTPGFPGPFQVPISCTWVIDSSAQPPSSIVVYLTQLFVSTGVTFTEYSFYEPLSPFPLESKRIFEVNEQNVITTSWIYTRNQYFVIEFKLDQLEGNHLRVLDDLLDVYGFNITYEMTADEEDVPLVRNDSCSVLGCSLAGNCYASNDFQEYWCSCFHGFSGTSCEKGPLCLPMTDVCKNGATCRHVGISAVCQCAPGFTGPTCEFPVPISDCEGDDDICSPQCQFDGRQENVCNCDSQNAQRVSSERWRYELSLRVANLTALNIQHPGRTLINFLEKQIMKFFRSGSLSKMEDLKILNITEKDDVVFHFFGSSHDKNRVRELIVKLLAKGRLGEINLLQKENSFRQEPALHLKSIMSTVKGIIREGDELMLSCIAQGSSYMTFNWYKDGDRIDVTRSSGLIWTKMLPKDGRGEYTSILVIEKIDALDEGRYTCQIADWGFQECKTVYIEVAKAPQVHILPMSASLQKGESIDLKCVSTNERRWSDQDPIGYSWRKNKELFPLSPGKEVWEDLKPTGSILRVHNIEKSTTYTCLAHTLAATQEQSVRIEVINHTSMAMCKSELYNGIKWSITTPGSTALTECPHRYYGIAKRQCLISDPGFAVWQEPNFSNCISDRLYGIMTNFRILARGYMKTTLEKTSSELVYFLEDRKGLYPGEGEPIIDLLQEILLYVNDTSSWVDLIDSTMYFYRCIDLLLGFTNSIINEHKVRDVQVLLNRWTLLWAEHTHNGTAHHFSYDSFVIDVMSIMDDTHTSYYIPKLSNDYPTWYTTKVAVHVAAQQYTGFVNTKNILAIVNYHNITKFLPNRSSQKNVDGTEIIYEVQSNILSISVARHMKVHIEVDIPLWEVREGWNRTCAVAPSLDANWDLSTCHHAVKQHNVTQCVCQWPGVYSALLSMDSTASHVGLNRILRPSSIVLIGCTSCLVQSLLAFVLLLARWWHRKTCILFLKLQCCVSVSLIMCIFMYSARINLPKYTFTSMTVLIEGLMLLGITSHLSKLLVVYTEVVRLPNVKNIKKTVFGITTGVTLLAVLCSLLAHHLNDNYLDSWWLPYDSAMFFTLATCSFLIVAMFIFLFFNLMHRLKFLLCMQDEKTAHIIRRRIGLLKRTIVLFFSMMCMSISSVTYVNSPNKINYYLFSVCSALLGFFIFFCYILHSESSLNIKLLKQLKIYTSKDLDYSSESDTNLFNFFTKQDPEVESDCAPPCIKSTPPIQMTELVPISEKLIPKPKMVTFNGEPNI
ncbi:uncharacterized protein LOC106664542 isoform X2 [Cimex lectularius]|nr:uncharacterized protein LOC106664542 isoform X2 [Cimex lectularius]